VTDYIPALISLAGGLLAFFFAKSGERNKVSGKGWVMAALLVVGGVLGLYVIHAKNVAADEARTAAAEEADKAAVFAAKQSALVMTLIGDFELKQTIPSLNLIFEQPFDEAGKVQAVPGFTGPFPDLRDDVVGHFEISIGDSYYSASFRSEGPGKIALSSQEGGPVAVFGREGVEMRGQTADDQLSLWSAGPEPPSDASSGGFAYTLALPADVQLRRLLYGIVAPPSLGMVRFRKGELTEDELKRIEQGLNLNPPLLALYIAEAAGGEPCDSYVHVPLRFVRAKEPLTVDGVAYDVFDLKLTPNGFTPDPCNNDPF
jgi:hypothetical protein